jgi:hypothetical protein
MDDERRPPRKKTEVPDRGRWEIASGIAASLPPMYDRLFRDPVGPDYERLEQEIWIELAREAVKVARTYNMPAGNATELAGTLSDILSIFFGPRSGEIIDLSPESGILLFKRCPFLDKSRQWGVDPGISFRKCLTFAIVAVESLNPKYSLRYVRSGCMGDRNCEIKIGLKDAVEAETGS